MTGADVDTALAQIAAGPSGPEVGAFFDLDGTIVTGFTAASFYTHRIRHGQVTAAELARTAALVADGKLGGDQARLGDVGIAGLHGVVEDDLVELGERLFIQEIAARIRPQARELVKAHQRAGHTVAVASSATRFQVAPVAQDLGIDHILCSEVAVEGGLLTGDFVDGMMWGERKARAVRDLSRREHLHLASSFAYGNGSEDVPFLSSVGRPHAVNPHPLLRRVAERQSWPVLELTDRQGGGLRSTLGTVAAIGGMNIALGVGLGVGLLRGNRRLGSDLACALGFETFLSLAGVQVEVVGARNLWTQRPAVFVMNHQSGLDAMVVCALLRHSFSGLGKQEARYSPATFLVGAAMDAVFIDRSDPASAREQLSQLEERLRRGLSVFVAPEGTRSPTPVLAPFKTGAFHVAMNAQVPVVPVVLRNTYDLMPGTAKTIRSGTVNVAVLDPIPTTSWTRNSIRSHVADVQRQFQHTLEHWPEDGP